MGDTEREHLLDKSLELAKEVGYLKGLISTAYAAADWKLLMPIHREVTEGLTKKIGGEK